MHLYLIGVQPLELDDFGGSLRDDMKAGIGPAIQHAIDFLARFGISGRLRETPLPEAETLACEHMVMSRYEAQRPSAEQACRFGDPRVLGLAEQLHDAAIGQPSPAPSGAL
jgi:hydrogenase maturation protease